MTPPSPLPHARFHALQNSPVWTFATLVLFVVALVVLYLADVDERATVFVGLVVSTIPSLVASLHSERASRDIRNDVMRDQVKAGTTAALDEVGVMTRTGPVASAQLAALTTLLEKVHGTSVENAGKLDTIQEQTAAPTVPVVVDTPPAAPAGP